MERVLEGVKVVEVSAWAFVPSAGAVLADWGAEVVKIEPPEGDPMRGLITGGVTGGPSFPWEIWNRGKRSIGLDLRDPEGREIVLRLTEQADVFLTSYLEPTRRKLGIDVDDVRDRNANIVYACGSGYGPLGDDSDRGGYDSITAAAARMAHLRNETYEPEPSSRAVYEQLYGEYVRLHDLFGRGSEPTMKMLKGVRRGALDRGSIAVD